MKKKPGFLTSPRCNSASAQRYSFDLDTSFTGRDHLRVELRGGQITRQLAEQTNMGGLDYEFDSTFDPFFGNPTTAHNLGFQTTALLTPHFNVAGWVGATFAQDTRTDNSARIFNWGVALSFLDLFREGDQIGVFVGMPPKLADIDRGLDDPDTALQFESFYTFPVNDYITINPGFYAIANPENDRRNDTIFVGLIRTIFAF